ncbi:MAG: UDP-2,3-diacylglucosamine diphosphatase LpxI [bacterium]|nr:UDP-2,3-diacylglucosamine diphosphatase LpxI [bacterium]MDD5354097.1 UDP-2,3-diacylglucosamine diphosphatase LpxI [bacterium]MDD5756363.1 UDP-2,3-diacylglucosamine diphosphatase LpxI [bacterium]
MPEDKNIGLIAGNGDYPLHFAKAAKAQGKRIITVALEGETEPGLKTLVDGFTWVGLGQLNRLIDIFKKENITQVVMAGQVKHFRLFDLLKLDLRAAGLLKRLPNKKADTILGGVAEELGKEGIALVDSRIFLEKFIPPAGILTKAKPSKEQEKDIEFGLKIAKGIAALDVGQTIVVKDRAVLAVEAMEGTDQTILRGGKIGKGDVVVVKVSKPNQDFRFDVPIIGENTITVLHEAGAWVLAFCAGETLILNIDAVIKQADTYKLCLVAIKGD